MALQYADQDLDPTNFGKDLSLLFTEEDVQALMSIDQGPGILLGMYLAKVEIANAEQAATEAAESQDY